MKKVLFISVLFFTSIIYSQGLGVQLGLNSAKLSGQIIEDDGGTEMYPITASAKTGINIGINYDFEISENLYLQPGLYYSQKGTEGYFKFPWENTNYYWDLSVNYLEIPVLIKYKYELNDEMSLVGLIGPSYNMGLNGKSIVNKNDEYDLDLINNYDDKDDDPKTMAWKKTYFGLQLGAGVMYQNFEFKLIYTAGLSQASIEDDKNGSYSYKEDFKQNVFSISLGYRFID